ncbi:MAG TPA: hypothetical protein VFX76_22410, partial [Roseiflexaceae bacterium]|nr:hypothetical protein [Roseiflexaceae bacterium]
MNEAGREQSSFEGTWNVVDATLPDGSFAYTGQIAVRRKRATYLLDWHISAGRYVGVGLELGEHLFVACGEQPAGLGIAMCMLQAGTTPAVHWSTIELDGAVGSGTFSDSLAGGFEGEHQLTLELPDGRTYGAWTLTISRQGPLYRLAWQKSGALHFQGLGLACSGGLAIGWYPDVAQLAFLDYHTTPAHA